MSRSKKTRQVGESTAKFKPRQKKSERVLAAKKQNNGHKSGSRHNEHLLKTATNGESAKTKDPRHGSKKPIELFANETPKSVNVAASKKPKLNDEQKLIKLENDPKLNQLLDMLEEGRELSTNDQQWLEKQLTEIETLLTKLGISEEDDAKQIVRSLTDDELLDQFESGAETLKAYQKQD